MDRSQFDGHVCCLLEGGAIADELMKSGVEVRILGIKKIYGLDAFRKFIQLINFIKNGRFDIVHTYLFSANIYGALAAFLAGSPRIMTSRRDTGKLREGKGRHNLAYWVTNFLVDRVICVTDSIKKIVIQNEHLNPHKVTTIYNGIQADFPLLTDQKKDDLLKEFTITHGAKVVGFVANFNWIKGHSVFIDAAKEVIRERSDIKFLLIGDGELRAQIQTDIENAGLTENVLLLGRRNDVRDLYQIMDLSLNLSYSEGMSNAILESLAAGVPVVATHVDGNAETMVGFPKEGFTGILIPPRDPRTTAKMILKILDDSDLRRKMSENARERIRSRFTVKIMVEKMAGLYKQFRAGTKVAFILSQFPETHETFILREFIGLDQQNLNFEIYSLKKCRDKIIHPQAEPFLDRTHYACVFSLLSVFCWLFNNPLGFCRSYWFCFAENIMRPIDFMKSQSVFFRSLHIARVMKRHRISHIHAHWATMPTTAAEIVSKLLNVPFSFTAHAWDIYLNRGSLKAKVRDAQFVITCTQFNKNYLEQLVSDYQAADIHLNYHGIDIADFAPRKKAPSDGNVILAIGRLVEQKGFEYLIKACFQLKNKQIPFRCVIVGDGPLRGELENLARSLGIGEELQMRGTVTQKEIKELSERATVFAAPSVIAKNGDRDGIPNVVIEAMARGVPVVATEVSGIPEVIIDQKTGILVPPHDEIAIAKAFERLFLDQALCAQLARNARCRIEANFDMEKTAVQLRKLFPGDENV